MALDMNQVAQQIDQLVTNSSEVNRLLYDLFYNPAPQDVAVKQYVGGVLTTVTMPNRAKVQTWYAETIPANMILRVPQDYATIQEALAWLAGRRIAPGASATIQLADGDHVATQINLPPHSDGDRIAIVGNATNPAACRLVFPAGHMGILFNPKSRLGLLDGITLVGSGRATSSNGMYLPLGVVCQVGSIKIDGFAISVRMNESAVLTGGKIACSGSDSILTMGTGSVVDLQEMSGDFTAAGFGVYAKAALAKINTLTATGPGDAGIGIDALWGARVLVETATISAAAAAAQAYYGSYVDIIVAHFTDCGVETTPAAGVVGNNNSFINVIS